MNFAVVVLVALLQYHLRFVKSDFDRLREQKDLLQQQKDLYQKLTAKKDKKYNQLQKQFNLLEEAYSNQRTTVAYQSTAIQNLILDNCSTKNFQEHIRLCENCTN